MPTSVPGGLQRVHPEHQIPAGSSAVTHGPPSVSIPTCTSILPSAGTNRPYVVAVKGSPRAYPAGAVPGARPYGGRGHPLKPAYPGPAASLRQLAIAAAGQIQPVTWRQGTKAGRGNPEAVMTSHFLAIRARPAGRHIPRQADRSLPSCWLLGRMAPRS